MILVAETLDLCRLACACVGEAAPQPKPWRVHAALVEAVLQVPRDDEDVPEQLGAQGFRAFVLRLKDILAGGVRRLAQQGATAIYRAEFLKPDEIKQLADLLASVMARGDLLGRAKVRLPWQNLLRQMARSEIPEAKLWLFADEQDGLPPGKTWLLEDESPSIPTPERALAYFRGLVPTLGVDPQRYGDDMRRRAFTMAVTTNTQVLARVQEIIRQRIETGQGFSTAAQEIEEVLEQAGITVSNPGYAQMVFRTNVMDAYTTGSDSERRDPDVIALFPVWMYSNPSDSRSRPAHAERNGKYYPADVPFTQIRGTDIKDVAQCRCVPIQISRLQWRRLKASGARIADGYTDPDERSAAAAAGAGASGAQRPAVASVLGQSARMPPRPVLPRVRAVAAPGDEPEPDVAAALPALEELSVALEVAGEVIRVRAVDAPPSAPPFVIHRGQTFAGWSWAELMALGDGVHRLGVR